VVKNDRNELIPTRAVIGWRMCIYYRKLNEATRKYHYPLPFMDQMLERFAGQSFYYFLDGYSGYNQIAVDPQDQEKQLLHVPSVFLLIAACRSVYVMPLLLSRDV